MKMKRRLSTSFLVIFLIFVLSLNVYAHDVPDGSKRGRISITMSYDGETVSGGTLTLYFVAGIAEDNGNYNFTFKGDFIGCSEKLTDIESGELAGHLAEYAAEGRLTGTAIDIGNDGTAVFSDLEPGLYLIVQSEASDGYEACVPFLVSVPMNENGIYVYEVDASPKIAMEKETETKPETPSAPSRPGSQRPTLPQTGQLNWPVPVMAFLGVLMFFVGWTIRFRSCTSEETFSGGYADEREMPDEK